MTTARKKFTHELKKRPVTQKKNNIMHKQPVRLETFVLTHPSLYGFLVFCYLSFSYKVQLAYMSGFMKMVLKNSTLNTLLLTLISLNL